MQILKPWNSPTRIFIWPSFSENRSSKSAFLGQIYPFFKIALFRQGSNFKTLVTWHASFLELRMRIFESARKNTLKNLYVTISLFPLVSEIFEQTCQNFTSFLALLTLTSKYHVTTSFSVKVQYESKIDKISGHHMLKTAYQKLFFFLRYDRFARHHFLYICHVISGSRDQFGKKEQLNFKDLTNTYQ